MQTSAETYALDIKFKKTSASQVLSLHRRPLGGSWVSLWGVEPDWEELPS